MYTADFRIDCEEDGFYLTVETDDHRDPQTWRISEPEAFYDHVKAQILPWLMERDEARRTAPSGVVVAIREDGTFRCDPDESGGYDLSDPKHPDFHSVHADLWDSREGK